MKRKKKNGFLKLLIGLLLVAGAFVYSIRSLADPAEESVDTTEMTHEAFIKRLAPHAQELQDGYGILPSIILGQAILESNWGQSSLASEYNNLFGIKAFGDEKKVTLETKEYVNEQWITINGDFRVYDSWEDSMDDHTMLFVTGTNWNPALYEGVLTAQNYQEAAAALQTAGYATDPGYTKKIVEVIETYHLDKYDRK